MQCLLAEMAKDKPRLRAALEMASAAIAKVSCGFGGPLSPRVEGERANVGGEGANLSSQLQPSPLGPLAGGGRQR